MNVRENNYFGSFVIHHYAGMVTYDVDGFCEKNKDILNVDLIEMVQGSGNAFVKKLFADDKVIKTA